MDVDSDTFNISPKSLEEAVEKVIADGELKPKAVVAVDLFCGGTFFLFLQIDTVLAYQFGGNRFQLVFFSHDVFLHI